MLPQNKQSVLRINNVSETACDVYGWASLVEMQNKNPVLWTNLEDILNDRLI